MTIEQGLYAKLVAAATAAGTRIYPLRAPQDAARPYIVFSRVAASRISSHDGPSGLATPRFQIVVVANTYKATRALADQVRIALDGATGVWSGITVQATFLENDSDDPYIVLPGSDDGLFAITSDYEIWHTE